MAADCAVWCDQFFMGAYDEMIKKHAHKYIVIKISGKPKMCCLDKTGPADASFLEFLSAVPRDDPRFIIYNVDFRKPDGAYCDKLLLVCWSPEDAPIRLKMHYTSAKKNFMKVLEKFGADIRSCEVCDWEDLTEEYFEEMVTRFKKKVDL